MNRLEETYRLDDKWIAQYVGAPDSSRLRPDGGVYPLSSTIAAFPGASKALASSGMRDGMQVLEVATGSGEMFRRLVRANRRGTTVGVDLSPNMAARTQRTARHKYPHRHRRTARR